MTVARTAMLLLAFTAGCTEGNVPLSDLGSMELVIASDATPVVRALSEEERSIVSAWMQRDQSAWEQGDHYFAHKGPVFIRGEKWELFVVDEVAVLCGHPGCWERPADLGTITDLFRGEE